MKFLHQEETRKKIRVPDGILELGFFSESPLDAKTSCCISVKGLINTMETELNYLP